MKTSKRIVNAAINSVLLLFCVSGAVVQAGQVTYPDDAFVSGSTLNASDLNSKFNELKSAVNDNNTGVTDNASDISANTSAISVLQLQQGAVDTGKASTGVGDFTTSITNIDSLTVNAPAAGVVVFHVNGSMALRSHDTGTNSSASCSLSDTDTTMTNSPRAYLFIPGPIPTFATTAGWLTPFSLSVPVVVNAAGPVTYYLNCLKVNGGGASNGFVQYINMYATYFPYQL
jgi:hypothetical protein